MKKQFNNKISLENNSISSNLSGKIENLVIPSELTSILSGEYQLNYNLELISNIPSSTNLETFTGTGTYNLIGQLINKNNLEETYSVKSNGTIIPTIQLNNNKNTSYLSKNIEGSFIYNNETTLLPNLNNAINLNSKGAINNFPKIEKNVTGGKKYLLSQNNSSSIIWTYQLINNGDVTTWDDIPQNKIYTNIDNSQIIFTTKNEYTESLKKSTNDFIILINPLITNSALSLIEKATLLTNYLNETFSSIYDIINNFATNLYKYSIRIIFDGWEDGTLLTLSQTLNFQNFYNGNIIIESLSNGLTLCSNEYSIFNFLNLENVLIKNINFQSIYTNINPPPIFNEDIVTDTNNKLFHLSLIKLENIESCILENCSLDNIIPRFIKNINMIYYSQNVLSYATYSLIFSIFSNLIIKNCTLKRSNIGIISFCNSTTEYVGNNNFEFYGMKYINEDITNIDWINITSEIYTDRSSIINYVAGNSICTMLPLSNQKYIDNFSNKIGYLSEINFKTFKNFEIGVNQFGSIFNHNHKDLIINQDSSNIVWEYVSGYLNDLRTFKNDTCIGMMNQQYACNLFELNDATKSIGYAYINPTNSYIPIGQYIQKYHLNGYNYEYNNLGKNDENRNNGNSILGESLLLNNKIGISVPLTQFYTDNSEIYNNGNFWINRLCDLKVTYNIPTLWSTTDLNEILKSLTSINAENLSLISLLNYYFSSQNIGYNYNISNPWNYTNPSFAMPIGLWSRPHKYTASNEEAVEKTHFSTFLISDRYNWYIRNNQNINTLKYDKSSGNKSKKATSVAKSYLTNYGSTIFYFDRTLINSDIFELSGLYKTALVGKFNNGSKNTLDLLPWSDLLINEEKNEALEETIIPDINTAYDFNMPFIRKYEISNQQIFESVRLPTKFWQKSDLPVLNIPEDLNNYKGNNIYPFYIKSCNFCLTPFLINRYGTNSGNTRK